jgi:hypothetical protein
LLLFTVSNPSAIAKSLGSTSIAMTNKREKGGSLFTLILDYT